MHNFLRGGEKGTKWIDGMFDTSSTSHGLTRFTFCNKSGSSQVTCRWSSVCEICSNLRIKKIIGLTKDILHMLQLVMEVQ
jgi:hypothetical protein